MLYWISSIFVLSMVPGVIPNLRVVMEKDCSIYIKLFFIFCRLLVIFCMINLLNYVDRGTIASNGVNGSPRACGKSGICDSGSGIQ